MATNRVLIDDPRASTAQQDVQLRPQASPVDTFERVGQGNMDMSGVVRAQALAEAFGLAAKAMKPALDENAKELKRQQAQQAALQAEVDFQKFKDELPPDLMTKPREEIVGMLREKAMQRREPFQGTDYEYFFNNKVVDYWGKVSDAVKVRDYKLEVEKNERNLVERADQVGAEYTTATSSLTSQFNDIQKKRAADPKAPTFPTGDIANQVVAEAKARNMDIRKVMGFLYIENRKLDPNAKNPNSTAHGLFQLLDSSWESIGGTKADRGDVAAQIKRGLDFIQRSDAELAKRLGREPTFMESYLAHQQGVGGATALLKADPNLTVTAALESAGIKNATKAAKDNGWAGKTVQQALNELEGKLSKGAQFMTANMKLEMNPVTQQPTFVAEGLELNDMPADGISYQLQLNTLQKQHYEKMEDIFQHGRKMGIEGSRIIDMMWEQQKGIAMHDDPSKRHFGIMDWLVANGHHRGKHADDYARVNDIRGKISDQDKNAFKFDTEQELNKLIKENPAAVSNDVIKSYMSIAGFSADWADGKVKERDKILETYTVDAAKKNIGIQIADTVFGQRGTGMLPTRDINIRIGTKDHTITVAEQKQLGEAAYLERWGKPRAGEVVEVKDASGKVVGTDESGYVNRLIHDVYRYMPNKEWGAAMDAGVASVGMALTDPNAMGRFKKALQTYTAISASGDPIALGNYDKATMQVLERARILTENGRSAEAIVTSLSDPNKKMLKDGEMTDLQAKVDQISKPFFGTNAINGGYVKNEIFGFAKILMEQDGLAADKAAEEAANSFKANHMQIGSSWVNIARSGFRDIEKTPEQTKVLFNDFIEKFAKVNNVDSKDVVIRNSTNPNYLLVSVGGATAMLGNGGFRLMSVEDFKDFKRKLEVERDVTRRLDEQRRNAPTQRLDGMPNVDIMGNAIN